MCGKGDDDETVREILAGLEALEDGSATCFREQAAVQIAVDHREQASGIIEILEAAGAETEVCSLAAGDYVVNEYAVIERKTARDFLVSIVDGRLFTQAAAMRRRFEGPLVLIEGDPFATDLKFDTRAIKGALISLSGIWRIPVLYSGSVQESAEMLMTLGRQERVLSACLSERKGYRPRRTRTRQLFILQGLPGVGPRIATLLLEHFGSVSAVMSASKPELCRVRRIGERTAERIHDILRSPFQAG